MFQKLLHLNLRTKFMALAGLQTLITLVILSVAEVCLQQAKANQAEATVASLYRSQLILLGVFIVLGGLGGLVTELAARRMGGAIRTLAQTALALAEGNLCSTAVMDAQDELGAVGTHLNQASAHLRKTVGAIAALGERTASGATQLSATASQVGAATHEISQGADSQRLEVAEATTSINQIASTLFEIGSHIDADVAQLADMLQIGEVSCRNVDESTLAMEAIRESSARVAAITTVIAEIANQTNLLSLNAAIEAAKAQEYGRGFTVVADEVRKLSERSAQAAHEIALLIQDSVAKVEVGARSVLIVKDGLDALVVNIRKQAHGAQGAQASVQGQVNESAVARTRMAATLKITEASASATHQLSASMTETTRTIDDLASTAGELRALTLNFRLA